MQLEQHDTSISNLTSAVHTLSTDAVNSIRPATAPALEAGASVAVASTHQQSPSYEADHLMFRQFHDEDDLLCIMDLVERELSEPYVIYTYRYFLTEWPNLCFLCYSMSGSQSVAVGAIVCKLEKHRSRTQRGYIAMLTTRPGWRKRGIGRRLVQMSIQRMIEAGADEICLETEFDNLAALRLYQKLGFIREKRLFSFYLNRKDAFRLICKVAKRSTVPATLAPPCIETEQKMKDFKK